VKEKKNARRPSESTGPLYSCEYTDLGRWIEVGRQLGNFVSDYIGQCFFNIFIPTYFQMSFNDAGSNIIRK
jgi:hypothetical protein